MVSAIPLIGGIPAGPNSSSSCSCWSCCSGRTRSRSSLDRPAKRWANSRRGREQVEDELQQMQSDDENESPLETDSTVNDDDDEFETETEKETSA